MMAAAYDRNGDPDVLVYREIPDPVVGPTTVLIRVAYAAIQGADLGRRRNMAPPETPYVGGLQAAGVVEAVGEKVTGVAIGQAVVGFAYSGSHAELFAADESQVYPVPAGLDLQKAASVPIEFGTAGEGLFERGRLQPSETVVIRGATGGVGIAAIQLAKNAGAKVIAVAGGAEALARVRALGADHVINYRDEDVATRIRELTGGDGANLVLDLAGGTPLIDALAFGGRYAVIGAASGKLEAIQLGDLHANDLMVFGFVFGKVMHTPRVRASIATHMQWVAEGKGEIPVDKVFDLSEAAAAHRHAESSQAFGRVLIRPKAA